VLDPIYKTSLRSVRFKVVAECGTPQARLQVGPDAGCSQMQDAGSGACNLV